MFLRIDPDFDRSTTAHPLAPAAAEVREAKRSRFLGDCPYFLLFVSMRSARSMR